MKFNDILFVMKVMNWFTLNVLEKKDTNVHKLYK